MPSFSKIQFILSDIEGTTSSKDFVYKVLFPYSQQELHSFLEENAESSLIHEAMKELKMSSLLELKNLLLNYIAQDKKDPWLKKIQGYIWEKGYKLGKIKSHFYSDAVSCLENWKKLGFRMGIYSSGSILAQKLLFTYSEFGNISNLIEAYFDTGVGSKREMSSYMNIANDLGIKKLSSILFLSDIEEELIAAAKAGFQVCLIDRDETYQSKRISDFPKVCNFSEISVFS